VQLVPAARASPIVYVAVSLIHKRRHIRHGNRLDIHVFRRHFRCRRRRGGGESTTRLDAALAWKDRKQRHHYRADVAEKENAVQDAGDNAPLLGGPRCRIFVIQSRHVRLQQLTYLTNIAPHNSHLTFGCLLKVIQGQYPTPSERQPRNLYYSEFVVIAIRTLLSATLHLTFSHHLENTFKVI